MSTLQQLRSEISALALEALRLKRATFDAGYHKAHVHLSNAESSAYEAANALLADPPLDSPLRKSPQ